MEKPVTRKTSLYAACRRQPPRPMRDSNSWRRRLCEESRCGYASTSTLAGVTHRQKGAGRTNSDLSGLHHPLRFRVSFRQSVISVSSVIGINVHRVGMRWAAQPGEAGFRMLVVSLRNRVRRQGFRGGGLSRHPGRTRGDDVNVLNLRNLARGPLFT